MAGIILEPPSDRNIIYNSLSPTTQALLIKMYGSKDNFLGTTDVTKHPLEEYLLEADSFLGDPRMIYLISTRIGAEIPPNQDPEVFLYDIFLTYLELESLVNKEVPPLQNFINMKEETYRNFAKKHIPLNELNANFHKYFIQRLMLAFQVLENA